MAEMFTNSAFILFAILFLGLALGQINIKGISLGSSGVLFVAMVAGHYQLNIPMGVSELGTALFVYCVGLGVGNRFFSSLRSRGKNLLIVALTIVLSGWLTAWGMCKLCGIDLAIGAGLFAGACTSTPALAAALDSAKAAGMNESVINIGYGLAYPFGVIGIVLFVQLLPRILHLDLRKGEKSQESDAHAIIARGVLCTNPEAIGKHPEELAIDNHMNCRITRILREGILRPLQPDDTLQLNDEVLMVGERTLLEHDAALLGHFVHTDGRALICRDEDAQLIVLSDEMSNKTLRQLDTLGHFGITISRITRLGNTFIPTPDTEIIRNDILRVVGTPEAIQAFKKECKHRSTAINTADMLSLMGGLTLGILLGCVSFSLGGEGRGFSLGMAGGPLVVALILGHFGKIGPIAGYMPRATRVLVMELGLMLFLAGAGIKGGEKLVETLSQQGFSRFMVGAIITVLPLLVGYLVARYLLRMELAETLGCICGSQTSTPALGAITAQTESQEPVIAYSTAYPIALILMTVLAQLLIEMA
ncbi:MAG: YidE/YbjL duplication [Akkermansia sp.]|nr:YidE/YbjL duplication [Akkermansia sp.]